MNIILTEIHEFKKDMAYTPTCMTLMGSPVSFANCSLMCLVGFGVDEKAVFRISSCFAFMVVLGPRRFEPALPSPLPPPAPPSGLLFSVWLSLVSGSPSREPSTDRSQAAASQSYRPHRRRYHLGPIPYGLAESAVNKLACQVHHREKSLSISNFRSISIYLEFLFGESNFN